MTEQHYEHLVAAIAMIEAAQDIIAFEDHCYDQFNTLTVVLDELDAMRLAFLKGEGQ